MSRFFLFFIVVASFVLPDYLYSQAQITVNNPRHQFGDVPEANGTVAHTFSYTNTGNDTLKILKMKVSHPDMTAVAVPEVLLPGKSGEMKIEIKLANLSGRIERHISIRTNDPAFPVRQMSLGANVIPSVKTTEELYLHKSGNLKFKSKHIAFDQFLNNQVRTDTFRIYNAWHKPMQIKIADPPAYTIWSVIPEVLEPGKEGIIVLTYNAEKSDNWGLSMNTFVLKTNDSIEAMKMITVGVNILEDFSYYKTTKDIEVPAIGFSETHFHFGNASPGLIVKHTYTVTNKGKGILKIRKIKASCGCTIPQLDKDELKPGETAKLLVEFNTFGYTGKQIKTITVISNDPESPSVMLSLGVDLP
jgi:hypothetical protein